MDGGSGKCDRQKYDIYMEVVPCAFLAEMDRSSFMREGIVK